jgi:hypothetical protein
MRRRFKTPAKFKNNDARKPPEQGGRKMSGIISRRALRKYRQALKHLERAAELLGEGTVVGLEDLARRLDKLRRDLERKIESLSRR